MLFQRLIWCALALALLVGSLQFGVQRWQAVPIILAAEVYEDQKVEAHDHHHEGAEGEADAWAPADGLERSAWTWIANVLHAFSMALLALAAMGAWVARRGTTARRLPLALAVAAAGWLSLHLWPSLGLPAEVPGMDAAPLGARQAWWLLAAASAAGACAILAFGRGAWRWAVAALLLALPFIVGAPEHSGDSLAGFSGVAHAELARLGEQFVWATTWVSLSFWAALGLLGAWFFARWIEPALVPR